MIKYYSFSTLFIFSLIDLDEEKLDQYGRSGDWMNKRDF